AASAPLEAPARRGPAQLLRAPRGRRGRPRRAVLEAGAEGGPRGSAPALGGAGGARGADRARSADPRGDPLAAGSSHPTSTSMALRAPRRGEIQRRAGGGTAVAPSSGHAWRGYFRISSRRTAG